MCVTEGLLIFKRNGYQTARIEFSVGEALGCEITGEESVQAAESNMEDELSYALLSALLGTVEFIKDEQTGALRKIVFEG